MNRILIAAIGLVVLCAAASSAIAQNQYIGYVYPAGGQQGTTFPIKLGGQGLLYASDVVVSGDGVSVRLVDHFRVMNNQEMSLLNQQLSELKKKETTISDAMVAKIASIEFPAPIGPITGADVVRSLICPTCGTANPLEATVCVKCNAKLPKPSPDDSNAESGPPKDEKEAAKRKLIERLQKRFAEDERNPAVHSQTELVFAEVTVAPDAKPGRREIRVVTKHGVSNPLPFFIDQVPEVARKPMKTCQLPVLGKEHLAQRKRTREEEEVRVAIPCTMNGQVGPGEVNRYRFEAKKGQRLVIVARARALVPYVADGVPGWFQAVLKLYDAGGKEVAYNDDYRSDPDPIIYYEVPSDGEYVLTLNEALYRGRESFVYRITVAERPFVTSIFPLGGRVGEQVKIEMDGWNLEKATLTLPPKEAAPGHHLLAATDGKFVSNDVPFALDTLPECVEKDPNDEPPQAQKVSLPIIINGRADRPGDSDVFEVDGKAGETIVAEVDARRLGSPFDSFLKVTNAEGKVIALNDDHFDAASGMNTDHADSYLMAKLPADGKYFIHLGDTRRHSGKEYAYRLRLSHPQPDFVLRTIPSRISIRSKASASLTVFAIRKDGFEGPIKVTFKDLPPGFTSGGVTIAEKQETAAFPLQTSLAATNDPINVTVVGAAKIGDREVVHEAVPAEDKMQAFLWRHLLPAETLPVMVFDPGYRPLASRARTPIRDEDRPKDEKPTLTRGSVEGYLSELERLYQEWLLTEDFFNRETAKVEARVIQ